MDERRLKPDDNSVTFTETPADVAVLYTWANMHGGKYHDFSASRREFRTQQRHRVVEAQRQAELEAANAREEAAARDLEEVSPVEQLAEPSEDVTSRPAAEENLKLAEQRVEQEYPAAQRHGETAAELKRAVEQAHIEMEQARKRASEQAARYAEVDKRWRESQGNTEETVPDATEVPYAFDSPLEPSGYVPEPGLRSSIPGRVPSESRTEVTNFSRRASDRRIDRYDTGQQKSQTLDLRRPRELAMDLSTRTERRPRSSEQVAQGEEGGAAETDVHGESIVGDDLRRDGGDYYAEGETVPDGDVSPEWLLRNRSTEEATRERLRANAREIALATQQRIEEQQRRRDNELRASFGHSAISTSADSLQPSREVPARWFALNGLINAGINPRASQDRLSSAKELSIPCLSIVSLSGGVGKTSLVATIGRALSSVGEKVLLADTTPYGLLPYYFGARELRPDVMRTFSPPPGSSDASVYMVNYDAARLSGDEVSQAQMVEEMMRHAVGAGRILLDLNGSSAWMARLLTRYYSNILVPIAPDMNSVLSIQSVDRFFAGCLDGGGRAVAPYYVLNQFDASLPLHQDVREVLRRQLGSRLLPLMIRRSPAVSEALAEGMTVIDYAPDSAVAEDYRQMAQWVRGLAAPSTAGLRSIRWSER